MVTCIGGISCRDSCIHGASVRMGAGLSVLGAGAGGDVGDGEGVADATEESL
jgi:hypothetical protein